MSIVGKSGWTFGAELASGALKELLQNHPDPEELARHLQAGMPVRNLDKLRATLTHLDVIDAPEIENPGATLVLRDVIEGLKEPKIFIDVLASIFNTTPQRLARIVAPRIDQGVHVDKDVFIAKTANVPIERKELDLDARQALEHLPETLRGLGLSSTAAMAEEFVARYQKITSGKAVWEPDNVVRLYRDHGSHVLAYLKRQVRLALHPSTEKEESRPAFEQFMGSLLGELDRHGLLADTSVLGGFSNTGLSGALYRAAEKYDAIERNGVMDASGVLVPPAFVDHGIVFGPTPGSASSLYADLSATATLIAVEPKGDELARVREHCKQGGVAIVLSRDGKPNPELDIKGVLELDLSQPLAQNALVAAQYVRAKAEDRTQRAFVSVAEHLAMSDAPSEINEVRQWARKESSRYRLMRIKNQALSKLASAHPDATVDQLTGWALGLARNVIKYTHGIDNFESNREWQAGARKAVEESGPEVSALAPQLAADIMWNSWFGIREFNAAPSFFDQHSTPLKFREDLQHLDQNAEHTFNKDAYAEVRLDYITTKFLSAKDSKPEVFLGSREEMQLYYRANGYEFDCTTHDTNGTEFHYFRSKEADKPSVMVIHGIDSEARLTQVAALMKVNGVDPTRCIVRGTMDRVRQVNRSMLEQRIMEVTAQGDVQKPIAAVIVGNKNETLAAVAEAAGVDPSELSSTEYRAGPFRFRAIEVKAKGDDAPQVVLAFAPAYGQLSQDLVEAASFLGARNFMLAGAGGSLDPNDKLNAVHKIIEATDGKKRIGFTKKKGVATSPFLKMIDVADNLAKAAANVFSETPLEQDKKWLERIRGLFERGKPADVDQETWAVFEGLYRASFQMNGLDEKGKPLVDGVLPNAQMFHLQPTLVQSDIVGQGHLAGGTVGTGYADPVKASTRSFIEKIGIGEVGTRGGFKEIKGAKRGLLAPVATKTQGAGVKSVDAIMPNMETMITSWKSSAEQFKGEKRPFRIVAERYGRDEEAFLEKLLTTLNLADLWIVVDAADPNNEKIRESAKRYDGALAPKSWKIRQLAEKYGFETILMSLEAEKSSIRGHFDFLLSYGKARGVADKPGKLDVIERFMQHGNADEDPNYSIPRTIVLGAQTPEPHAPEPLPEGMSDAELERFIDRLSLVHEEIGAGEQDPKKRAEKLLAARSEVVDRMAKDWPRETVEETLDFIARRAATAGFHYTGGMSPEDMDALIAKIKKEVNIAFDGGVQVFADGLTYRFPGLKPAITERYREQIANGALNPLPARTNEKILDAPKFYPLDGLDDFFRVAGTDHMRRPILWAGASRASWGNVKTESQYALHLFVELMAKLLADKKDEFAQVTGGTAWGFEAIVHEVFSREGWHILGTLAQNTSVSKDKWEPDERIQNWTFTGINWYGMSRPVTDTIVIPRKGIVVDVAGGGIAKDQIGLQLATNANAWLMTDIDPSEAGIEALRAKLQAKADKNAKGGKAPPVVLTDAQKRAVAGASVEMGEMYPARAFDTLDRLCEGMGLSEILALAKKAAKIDGPIKIRDVESLAQSMGVETAAIKRRYFP